MRRLSPLSALKCFAHPVKTLRCRHHCNISTGDDNVALHFNNTLIEKNFFGTGHGASIGSLGPGSAWLTNITVRDKFVPL